MNGTFKTVVRIVRPCNTLTAAYYIRVTQISLAGVSRNTITAQDTMNTRSRRSDGIELQL